MRFLPLLGLLALAACDTSSHAFRTGYENGCANGASTGDFVQRQLGACDLNELEATLDSFDGEGAYQRGRLAGYEDCFIAHCEIVLD